MVSSHYRNVGDCGGATERGVAGHMAAAQQPAVDEAANEIEVAENWRAWKEIPRTGYRLFSMDCPTGIEF